MKITLSTKYHDYIVEFKNKDVEPEQMLRGMIGLIFQMYEISDTDLILEKIQDYVDEYRPKPDGIRQP